MTSEYDLPQSLTTQGEAPFCGNRFTRRSIEMASNSMRQPNTGSCLAGGLRKSTEQFSRLYGASKEFYSLPVAEKRYTAHAGGDVRGGPVYSKKAMIRQPWAIVKNVTTFA